jgi:hypothetical protein
VAAVARDPAAVAVDSTAAEAVVVRMAADAGKR